MESFSSGKLPAAQTGGQSVAGGSNGEAEARRAAEEQMRRDLLASLMDSAARERCTPYHVFHKLMNAQQSGLLLFPAELSVVGSACQSRACAGDRGGSIAAGTVRSNTRKSDRESAYRAIGAGLCLAPS